MLLNRYPAFLMVPTLHWLGFDAWLSHFYDMVKWTFFDPGYAVLLVIVLLTHGLNK